MKAKAGKVVRRIAVPGVCVALFLAVAACGGGSGNGDRSTLEAQLKKGPLENYQEFKDDDGKPLDPEQTQRRLDCYADVLAKYGDKEPVEAYAKSGEGYMKIGISKPKDFKAKADACVGIEIAGQYAPPYPAAAFT